MTFTIDTGNTIEKIDPIMDACPDWLMDMLPENPTRDQIISAVVENLVGEMTAVKAKATARKRVLVKWQFMSAIADTHPEKFDWILQEYAERLAQFE